MQWNMGGGCCCIDSKANQSADNKFAGGAVRLFVEQGADGFKTLLTHWAEKGKAGSALKAHKYCGWLLLVQDMKSAAAQEKVLKDMEKAINAWNKENAEYPSYTIEIDWKNGTAKEFMTN